MQIFARMTKVDEVARTVTGVIANEALDHSGEVFDYASSKPLFEAWSGGIAKATDGKSVGNVRSMHGNIVAGVVKQMDMDDEAKAISVCAKIVDDNEWNKVLGGCYTGFSIGGSYARKWKDDNGLQRYTADPVEVSIVDLPCNPDAQFSVVKADGTEEMHKFVTTADNADALAKWADNLTDDERAAVLSKMATAKPIPTGDLPKSATSPQEDTMNEELQKNHDLAKADLAKAQADLSKAISERDELKKALDTAAAEISARDELLVKAATALDERNAIIEKFQNAPAPVKAALMAVAKGDDLGVDLPEIDKVKKADGTVDEAATEIKKALMNPVFTR